jgi:Dolichyl-phosphate-mannose-protein mannosyltransferase
MFNLKQLSNQLKRKRYDLKAMVYLAIPLALVAFTHLWNPIGFPTIHPDEGYYIGRSIHVSEGLGPKEDAARYDHPYSGWLFLGSIFSIFNYPDSTNPTPGNANSIELIWLFPRVTMGILAVVDTFLIYKIAERRYNRNIAFIAAILFAVMPYTWLIRRVLIEPIQLPFLLTSILFALYTGIRVKQIESEENLAARPRPIEENKMTVEEKNGQRQRQGQKQKQVKDQSYHNYSGLKSISSQNMILLLSSGIFLGLTIFTKIPAITLIPLVGFIIFTNNKKSFKALGLWIIPVVLIPLIWPIHTMLAGEFDQWQDGIIYQTTRASKPLFDAINDFYNKDPVLLILGTAGFVFATIVRKDLLFIFWVVPFLVFFYAVDYVSHFHMIPLIPAFCIGAAVLIGDLSEKVMRNRRLARRLLPIAIISAIGIFGLLSTTSLIVKARNSSDFDVIASVVQYLPDANGSPNVIENSLGPQSGNEEPLSGEDGHVTIIGTSRHFWILQYVFDRLDYDYKSPNNMVSKKTLEGIEDGTERVLMIADENMQKIVSGEELPRTSKAEIKAERLSDIYDNSKTVAKVHKVEIRTNY